MSRTGITEINVRGRILTVMKDNYFINMTKYYQGTKINYQKLKELECIKKSGEEIAKALNVAEQSLVIVYEGDDFVDPRLAREMIRTANVSIALFGLVESISIQANAEAEKITKRFVDRLLEIGCKANV